MDRSSTFETPAKTPSRPPPIGIGAYNIVDDASHGTPAKSKDHEWMDNSARSVKRLPSD
jgi:hypothetical protein